MSRSSIPVGRIRRAAQLGRLLGGEAARTYASRAANRSRSDEEREAADERRRLEAARRVVEVLGQMKGGAMKVGQMGSLMDFDRLPDDEAGAVQAKLAELQRSAPQVPFKDMRKVIEHELDGRIANLFAELDPNAAAAASIGQVYRARLHDGREVAVKVQYPGIASAVRADLQNLGLLIRAARHFVPGLDPASAAVEVRERISEELDYEYEAQAQRMFARRWRGHPFIFIPDVISELCGERVLVSEWVDGVGLEQLKARSKRTRDRAGEIIFRFFFGSLYRFGHFSGDPHPGNFLLQRDGRMAFFDFGNTKLIPRATVETEREVLRAALERDGVRVHAALASLGFFDPCDARFEPARVLAQVRALSSWYASDERITLTPAYVSRVMVDAADPRSEYWELTRNETVPADSLFANRMQAMTLAALGQLEATANWHRVMCQWLYDSPPCSALGVVEAQFFGSSPRSLPRAA
ncbi:MAG TPA: AarF/ABC1/UbiB kinase family protein [Solirubrobacteraceae bacterium]|jgi:predicted unusual protein kinase regulating ubiquinone biosynthesis (AarF/ABC1/UbiB family)|nr:AarF/ABC1/UbiB kinase family protein [Solirubrobacteraceae bacterium]